MRTGAPVVPVFMVRDGFKKHRVLIQRPLEIVHSGDIQKDVETNTQRINQTLESVIRVFRINGSGCTGDGKERRRFIRMKNLPQKKIRGSALRTASQRRKRKSTPTSGWGTKYFIKIIRSWGGGIVVETWASDLPGGLCFVRILFQDGKQRVFDNSFDSSVLLLLCRHHSPQPR